MNTIPNLEIGTVQIEYRETGEVKSASFHPVPAIRFDSAVTRQLLTLDHPEGPHQLKNNSDLILAAWFTKLNEIELADRERYDIDSEIIRCDKYPNGSIQTCTIKYTFKSRA